MTKYVFFGSFFLLLAVGLGALNYAVETLQSEVELAEASVDFQIDSGDSLRKVLQEFEQRGWIQHARLYEYWFRVNDMTDIQRGEYTLQSNETVVEIVEKFIDGQTILRSVQFIEGQTAREFIETVRNNAYLVHTLENMTDEEIKREIDADLDHLEGWLFPDTYLFETGTSDLEILQLAHERMVGILEEAWQNKAEDAIVKTPYEALILASIIEKETGAAFERATISGVFTRRLEIGMRMQTDPTVIYGLGEDFDGNLTRTHLRQDTPYNTYTRNGLPPTPIANPGREAIVAALNPEEGDTLFFVAKGDGTHYFSRTLEEHNDAVRQYQRFGRREDYQSSPQDN